MSTKRNIQFLKGYIPCKSIDNMKTLDLVVGDVVHIANNYTFYVIEDATSDEAIPLPNSLFAKPIPNPIAPTSPDSYTVDTIEKLKGLRFLKEGDVVEVLGYYSAGDGTGHQRIIASEDDGSGVQLENGLWANIVPNSNGNDKMDKGDVNPNLSSAEKIVKALEANQGLKFDTILNIDDVGTKQEGYCYMFEGDIYKCIKQTEVTTPESANFQPISNNKLSDRLDNLNISRNSLALISKKYSFTSQPGVVVNDDTLNSKKFQQNRLYIVEFIDLGGSYSSLLVPISEQWRTSCVIGTNAEGSVGIVLTTNGYAFTGQNARVTGINIYEIKFN